jgi:hypothetical protein
VRERDNIEVRANFRSLLRGDHAAMGVFMSEMAQNGLMNDDEIREEFLDMNPFPDGSGKRRYKQLNMMPVDALGSKTHLDAMSEKESVPQKISPPKANGKPNGIVQ